MGKLDSGLSLVRTVLSLRLAPVLLVVFVVLWPLAGFPWWPVLFVVALGGLLRVLGFGYLLAGKRGPIALVALLVATTLLAWSPWAVATGVGAALAGRGLFLLPRYHLLAAGLVLAVGAGAGWTVEVVTDAAGRDAASAAEFDQIRAKLLPRGTRAMLNALMRFATDNDPIRGCFMMTEQAQEEFAQRWGAEDCAAAFTTWNAQVTIANFYEVSPALYGDTEGHSPDYETYTLDACGLYYDSIISGSRPVGGPTDIGRMRMVRVLGEGYRITQFRPC